MPRKLNLGHFGTGGPTQGGRTIIFFYGKLSLRYVAVVQVACILTRNASAMNFGPLSESKRHDGSSKMMNRSASNSASSRLSLFGI